MIALFPRLLAAEAIQRMQRFTRLDCREIAIRADSELASLPVTYAATAGKRIDPERLAELREAIRTIATASGYPGRVNLEGQQRFDRETALLLHERAGVETGEAIRAEAWQFIAAGLLPDVVFWRWSSVQSGEVSADRFLGGNRNCFGRLWLRAEVFWDDRLADPSVPLNMLLEDNFTAILERSAFAAHRLPCREVARAFLLRRHLVEGIDESSPAQTLLRDAMRRVIRTTGYSALWSLDEADLCGRISDLLDASLRAMSVTPVLESELVRRRPDLALSHVLEERIPVAPAAPRAFPVVPIPRDASRQPDQVTSEPLPDWFTMKDGERTETVWRVLIGQGEQPEYELVRIAAQQLRTRGQISFERLREGGLVFRSVQDAIERGVRSGRFDKPSRGHRRAIATSIEQIPLPALATLVREKLAAGIPAGDAVAVLVAHLRSLVGVDQHGSSHEQVSELLKELLVRGEVIEVAGTLQGVPQAHAEEGLPSLSASKYQDSTRSELGLWIENLKADPARILRGLGEKVALECPLFTVKMLLRAFDPEGRTRITEVALGRQLALAGIRQANGGIPLRLGAEFTRLYAVREPEKWINAKPKAVREEFEKYFGSDAAKS